MPFLPSHFRLLLKPPIALTSCCVVVIGPSLRLSTSLGYRIRFRSVQIACNRLLLQRNCSKLAWAAFKRRFAIHVASRYHHTEILVQLASGITLASQPCGKPDAFKQAGAWSRLSAPPTGNGKFADLAAIDLQCLSSPYSLKILPRSRSDHVFTMTSAVRYLLGFMRMSRGPSFMMLNPLEAESIYS